MAIRLQYTGKGLKLAYSNRLLKLQLLGNQGAALLLTFPFLRGLIFCLSRQIEENNDKPGFYDTKRIQDR